VRARLERICPYIRSIQWEIENCVHWVLDVIIGEDVNRMWEGESAQNLALIRKLALNLWRQKPSGKVGIAAK
jgi:predicted transposase YbfD/YdcC